MIGIDRGTQILQPAPCCLVGHDAGARRDLCFDVIFVLGSGAPIDKIAAELSLDISDRLVTKKRIQIQKADKQKIVLPDFPWILRFWILRRCVNRQNVSYWECTRIG